MENGMNEREVVVTVAISFSSIPSISEYHRIEWNRMEKFKIMQLNRTYYKIFQK